MTKAYLVFNVEGYGDTYIKVVNEAAFNWILNGGPMPLDQKMIQIKFQNDNIIPGPNEWKAGSMADWVAEANRAITQLDVEVTGPYADQERAMAVMSSSFNGNIFNAGYVTVKKAMKFIQSNGLILEDEFRGNSW